MSCLPCSRKVKQSEIEKAPPLNGQGSAPLKPPGAHKSKFEGSVRPECCRGLEDGCVYADVNTLGITPRPRDLPDRPPHDKENGTGVPASRSIYDEMLEDSLKQCEELQESLDVYISEVRSKSRSTTPLTNPPESKNLTTF